jgi:hypothetical protein
MGTRWRGAAFAGARRDADFCGGLLRFPERALVRALPTFALATDFDFGFDLRAIDTLPATSTGRRPKVSRAIAQRWMHGRRAGRPGLGRPQCKRGCRKKEGVCEMFEVHTPTHQRQRGIQTSPDPRTGPSSFASLGSRHPNREPATSVSRTPSAFVLNRPIRHGRFAIRSSAAPVQAQHRNRHPEQSSRRRRYFFLALRAGFFFAGAFFAVFLAFFTIAALLAIMMAVVEQCSRESRAPHPDYYRTRKKTRFHLNELFTRRLRARRTNASREISHAAARLAAICTRAQSNKYKIAEVGME